MSLFEIQFGCAADGDAGFFPSTEGLVQSTVSQKQPFMPFYGEYTSTLPIARECGKSEYPDLKLASLKPRRPPSARWLYQEENHA